MWLRFVGMGLGCAVIVGAGWWMMSQMAPDAEPAKPAPSTPAPRKTVVAAPPSPAVDPIIDTRKTLTRIAARAGTFYHHVTLLVSFKVDENGQPMGTSGYGTLSTWTQGPKYQEKWFEIHYNLTEPQRHDVPMAPPVFAKLPPEWPALEVEKVLPDLQGATASAYWVFNGTLGRAGLGFTGQYDPSAYPPMSRSKMSQDQARALGRDFNASATIWPRFDEYFSREPGHTLTIHRDAARKGAIVVEEVDRRDGRRIERTRVIDESRFDVPLETVTRVFAGSAEQPGSETRIHYLEHKQSEKFWYPTRWRTEYVSRKAGGEEVHSYSEHCLSVARIALEERWFSPPTSD